VATLDDGLYRVDLSTDRETRYMPAESDPASISHSRVRRLVPEGNTTLYVGTENGGLNILDLRAHRFTRVGSDLESETSMNSASIWSMYRDDQGILWIGTYNGGVNYASPWGRQFELLKARPGRLSDPHVNAVIEDSAGNLWIGTNNGGLNRLDRRTGIFTHYRHDPKDGTTIGSDAVWALLEDKQGYLWIGGWDGGLGRLDPASGRFKRYRHVPADPRSIVSDHVWRILELRTGELLVATHEGADLLDRKTSRFTRLAERYPGAGSGAVFSAAEDGKGDLWLVGNLFVEHVERGTGRITRYRNNPLEPQSLGGGWTQAVLIDSVGNVWLGTEEGLSCVVAGGGATRRYTTGDGLPNNTITSIQEDGSGNLWVATNHGLSKLVNAILVPSAPTFQNFDVHDGLQGHEFARNASYRGRDGKMFFGGSRGLNMFYPERIRRNPHVPPIVLTDLKIFNIPVEIGAPGSPLEKAITGSSRLALSYRHSMVTFEFAALNFVLPQKNQHAYMLEGFDRDWNVVGARRFATYTNLPHGEFTLRVRGSNNDGVWNDEGVSLKIRVTPPFWRADWFIALVGLSLLSAGFGLYRRRISAHVIRQKELEMRIAEAVADIRTLHGLLPICAWCKKVRDDGGYWSRLEEYVSDHTHAEFSHGICPECRAKNFGRRTEEPPRDS
jgi:streptogramin lyase